MQVRADRAADAAPLLAALAVVPEARQDPPERDGPGIQPRAARVVLEPRKRAPDARLELALEQDVADHTTLAGDGLEREQPDAGQVGAVEVAIGASKELIAAADGKKRRAGLHRAEQTVRLRREIIRDERLLAILAAADVEQIVLARPHAVADAESVDLELMATPRRAPREHGDVAPIGIDVQVVGIEVSDTQLHAARSQYGRTKPRSATILRSASIAV